MLEDGERAVEIVVGMRIQEGLVGGEQEQQARAETRGARRPPTTACGQAARAWTSGRGCYHGGLEMLTALGLTGTLAGALALASPGPPSPAEALARRIEARHRGVRDLTARFVQTYRSGALGREVVEKGVLSLKPPSRMRWEYRDPEKKTFVSDGKTSYFLRARGPPGDPPRAVRCARPARHAALRPRGHPRHLRGRAGKRPRRAAAAPSHPAQARARDRAPRTSTWTRPTASARSSVLDAQGNRSQFAFDDIRENVGLDDRLFRFEVPRGVEVIAG